MADTINIAGKKVPKMAAIAVGGVLVVGGALYYRQKQNATTAVDTSSADANTGIDPATGYAYGSAEDSAALSNQGQYISPDNSSSFASGQVIGYDSSGDPIYGAGTGLTQSNMGPGSFTNNAAWAQYVEEYLVDTEGADAATIGNSIGKYITGQALSTDMISAVQNAIAIGGYPPVAGTNGNPPGYVTANTGTTTPPPNGGGTTTTPPPTTTKLAKATGLRVTAASKNSISYTWSGVAGSQYYDVYATYQGSRIGYQRITVAKATINGLSPNRTYTLHVIAGNSKTQSADAQITRKTAA